MNSRVPIAHLEIHNRISRKKDVWPIHPRDDFYIGRRQNDCLLAFNDPTISKRHLRLHCVVYEGDFVSDVPPMVYVHDLSINGIRIKKAEPPDIHVKSSQNLGRAAGPTLLSDGDEVFLTPGLSFIYHEDPRFAIELDVQGSVDELERKGFSSRYVVTGRKLGVGGYGTVYVAIERSTGKQLACKHIDLRQRGRNGLRIDSGSRLDEMKLAKERLKLQNFRDKQQREFEVLEDLSHPNIIQLAKVFHSRKSLYIFQELISGGDLYSYLDFKGGKLVDAEAGLVIRQVLKAVAYLHDRNIVHRDLKPDNVLMTSLSTGARIVLTDFGNARHLPKNNDMSNRTGLKQRMFSVVGTLEYVAPEVHCKNKTLDAQAGYSKAVDMWSIGSMTVALLIGDIMFTNRADPEYSKDPAKVILTLAAECNLDGMNEDPAWEAVGHRAKDFVRKLLVLDENKRLTATKALQHRWFSNSKHCLLFDSVYQKSIRGWQPRPKSLDLVEDLDSLMGDNPTETAVANAMEDTASSGTSPFFASNQTQDAAWTTGEGRSRRLPTIREVFEEDMQLDDEAGIQISCKDSFDPIATCGSQLAEEDLVTLPGLSHFLPADQLTPTTQDIDRFPSFPTTELSEPSWSHPLDP
ncbi:Pkinase-domain-containing protein [Viridothelium virens]|uniref:Pkinase-domain-containing protein n=1 Tax=Viridothelium virens TaxID=1048519 RepID=A0A6A6HKL3_VIRVR|nr:Pkinase-domain-containing protein [Viridothelium virens]